MPRSARSTPTTNALDGECRIAAATQVPGTVTAVRLAALVVLVVVTIPNGEYEMAKRSDFPKTVTVYRDEPRNDDPYLMVAKDLDALVDGELVATYQLVKIERLTVTRTLGK